MRTSAGAKGPDDLTTPDMEAPLSAPPGPQYVEWDEVGGICVIRFTTPTIRDDRIIRVIFEQINKLVNEVGYHRLVLNFAGIEAFASYAIGQLVVLNKKLQPPEGRLVLCNLTPIVGEIIDILNLRKQLKICRSEQDAIQSFD